jgi:hypothetical protein
MNSSFASSRMFAARQVQAVAVIVVHHHHRCYGVGRGQLT